MSIFKTKLPARERGRAPLLMSAAAAAVFFAGAAGAAYASCPAEGGPCQPALEGPEPIEVCPLITPVPIGTFDDLKQIGNHHCYPMSGDYVLMNDIDIDRTEIRAMNGGKGWVPIMGVSDAAVYPPQIVPFTGTFDGNGKTIRGLYIDNTSDIIDYAVPPRNDYRYQYSGLFGVVADGGTVKNLTLADVYIATVVYTPPDVIICAALGCEGRSYAGAAAGWVASGGSVSGVTSSGEIRGGYLVSAGGIAGLVGNDTQLRDNLTNCGGFGTALGKANCVPPPAFIVKSRSTAKVVGIINDFYEMNYIGPPVGFGGIAGLIGYGGYVDKSSYAGDLTGGGGYAGGIAGYAYGVVSNSYARGTIDVTAVCVNERLVTADMPIDGGLATGYDCAASTAGGVAGGGTGGVSNSYSASVIFAASRGGIVRVTDWRVAPRSGGNVVSSYWDITVSGVSDSVWEGGGGLDGREKTTGEMTSRETFDGWDFETVWRISADINQGYPYLDHEAGGLSSIAGRGASQSRPRVNAAMPAVSVRGKTLNVRVHQSQSLSAAPLQVRMIDMRGRTVLSRTLDGGGAIPLSKVPAGRYVVDVRQSGVRVGNAPVTVR